MNPLAVVVPCYNEADRLDEQAFRDAMASSANLRLVFVDDGSEDDTRLRLRSLVDEIGPLSAVLPLPSNVGKAEAVRRGMLFALDPDGPKWRPEAVGYWDADLATPLSEIPRFSQVLDDQPETLAVLGARVQLMGRDIERRAVRHYAGRVFGTLASITLGFPVYDTQCGAKLFRVDDDLRRLLELPFSADWAFDVELLARMAAIHGKKLGARRIVVELPLEQWRDVAGSKVRVTDLPRMIGDLWRLYRRYD